MEKYCLLSGGEDMGMTPKYNSVEEIEDKIEQYFEDCKCTGMFAG